VLSAGRPINTTGWHHRQGNEYALPSVRVMVASLPSQLLFRYTDTNTGGTVKKSTTEFTSSQNHSLSLAAINYE